MSLPLNIDFQQILLHLLNFSILSLGLYLLLYKPVENFMDKRAAYYLSLHNQAEAELKQAKDLKLHYDKRLDNLKTEIEEYREKAVIEAKKDAGELLKNAEAKASEIIENAKKAAQLEREKIIEGAQKEITAMIVSATEKILTESSSDSLDQFLNSVKKE